MKPILWMRAVRDYQPKPGPVSARYPVLWSLALRMDAAGVGYCSVRQVAEDADVAQRTARQHLTWAQRHELLVRTRKGHRLGNGKVVASEWLLTEPATGEQSEDSQPATGGHLSEISTGKGSNLNRQGATSQPASRQPPKRSISQEVKYPSSSARASDNGSAPDVAAETTTMDGDIPEDKNVTEVARRIGVTAERARDIVDEIRHRHEPRNLKAYIAKLSNDNLSALSDEIGSNLDSWTGPWAGLNQQNPKVRECSSCRNPFWPESNRYEDGVFCPDCREKFNDVVADKLKSRKQQETDAWYERSPQRANAREAWEAEQQ